MEQRTEKIFSGCRSCHVNCGVECTVVNGRLERVDPTGPEHLGVGKVCLRGMAAPQFAYTPTRLRYPLKRAGKRGEGKWERISWDQAVDEIARKIHEMSEQYGPETFVLPGRTGRHDMGWIAHRIARTIGTPNNYYGAIQVCLLPQFHGCVHFGSQLAQPTGMTPADLRVCVGVERAYSHPIVSGAEHAMQQAFHGKWVVFDPVAGPFALHADVWCPVRPGTDLAWCMAMIRHLVETQTYREDFVTRWTNAPFLVREDNGDLLRESDVVVGGSPNRYMVWNRAADGLGWWDNDEVQWEGGASGRAHYDRLVELFYQNKTSDEPSPAVMPDTMRPALRGTYTVELAGSGYRIECKPVLEKLWENVEPWTFERAAEVTWVPEEKLRQVAQMISEANMIDFMEGSEYMATNASQYLNSMSILKMLTGNVDNPAAEMDQLYPVTPMAFPGEFDISYADGLPIEQKRKRLGYFEHRIGCGYSWEEWSQWQPLRPENADGVLCFPDVGCVLEAAETGRPYEVHGIIAISSNWLMHDPSTARWMRLLEDEDKIKLHVVTDLVMTPTAEMADYVLPAQTWMERNYLAWSVAAADPTKKFYRRAIQPICEARHDYEFGAALAKRLEEVDPRYNNGLLNPGTSRFYAGEHGRFWVADTIDEQRDILCREYLDKPLEECLELGAVSPPGVDVGPARHDKYLISGKFPTDTGKCNMFSTLHYKAGYAPLPVYDEPAESPVSRPEVAEDYPYVLATGKRQAGFFHSEFRQLPWMREVNPVPEVFMNPATAAECGVTHGDWVWVEAPPSHGRAPLNKIMGQVSFRLPSIPGVVTYSQHAWWRPEKSVEDDLHGAFEWNVEGLCECVNSAPETGTPGLRSQLCKVYPCTEEDMEKYRPMITREQMEAFAPMTEEEMNR